MTAKTAHEDERNFFSKNIAQEQEPLAPEDFYYDGPYLVFTKAYHLKRGTCCGSGCRHCPFQ